MDRQQLITFGIALAIGIIIGLVIAFALWHGTGSVTCAAPLNC